MLLPGVLFFIIFHYVPMGGLLLAFKDYRMDVGILRSPWNGFATFARLFRGDEFIFALRNTLIISGLRLGFGFFAPIGLALLLNEVRISWYKRTVQTVTYLPFFFSWVVLGGIFLMLFSMNGPVNQIVTWFGLEPQEFLTSDAWFITVLITTGIWQGVGYGSVIYLAALAGISPTLYEAAVVDGAGRWKQTLHITLPSLVPTMVTLFILSLGQILNAGFDQVFNMYNPMVYDVSDILGTYILRRMVSMDFSLATAAGLFKAVVGFMLVISANALANRISKGEQGIW
jgi:putative aldouronate transport system permease protein